MPSGTSNLEDLRAALTGRVIGPGDAEYDTARSVWNGEIDRRPAVVARCADPADVAATIRFARDAGLDLTVRGGGHSFGGQAVCDGGVVIHLGDLNAVSVDPVARTARCGGGTTWAQLDAATQEHGLATPGGTVSHTGVGGLTLGGGFGWLTHEFGLSCDNLLAATVVTADGRTLRAAADEHPDLYWALRGGGGNFGVVTEFEFQLHPVGPLVQLGLFFWDIERGPDALRLARQVVVSLVSIRTGAQAGIAHFAHLGGFLGGFLYLRIAEARSPAARFRSKVAPPAPRRASDADLERWRSIDAAALHPVNREELARVMAKVATDGAGALTPGEREFLDRFSAR